MRLLNIAQTLHQPKRKNAEPRNGTFSKTFKKTPNCTQKPKFTLLQDRIHYSTQVPNSLRSDTEFINIKPIEFNQNELWDNLVAQRHDFQLESNTTPHFAIFV